MSGSLRSILSDRTVAFVRDPYRFFLRRSRQSGARVTQTELLLQPTVTLEGPDGARVFSDPERFQRHSATPLRIQRTLFGVGGVQGLDGEAHRRRKEMFLFLLEPESVDGIAAAFERAWRDRAATWPGRDRIVLYDEVRELLCRAACDWAGVPVPEAVLPTRTRVLASLYEFAGAVGVRHGLARLNRLLAERWFARLVRGVRSGPLPPDDRALSRIALHREGGHLLSGRVAAVELLNVVRPIMAASVFLTFAAHALHEHPEWRGPITEEARSAPPAPGGPAPGSATRAFVQEVRRLYPFFPLVGATPRKDVAWAGAVIPAGRRTLLDLYGTDHDPETWPDPEAFRPERFAGGDPDPFAFIPQGAGDYLENHRCPGERITIGLMGTMVRLLALLDYEVPPQDLSLAMTRMPALPHSRFVIGNVRP